MTVGTEFQQFKKNEGWIGKSFKGIDAQAQWIFKKVDGKTAAPNKAPIHLDIPIATLTAYHDEAIFYPQTNFVSSQFWTNIEITCANSIKICCIHHDKN